MEHTNSGFPQKFLKTTRLPDLPKGVSHLLNALFDDDMDFSKLTGIIENHPSISARLISLANSPWSAPVTPITTIGDACSRLGLDVVRSVSIALSISSPFNPVRCPSFDVQRFWTTSMLVAEGAAILASAMPKNGVYVEMQKTTQTAGIIHNLGLLLLAENMAKETEQALQATMEDSSLTVCQALNQFVGADYCEAGYWLGKEWGIPESLLTAIRYHQDSRYHDEFWEISHLIGSTAIMVGTLSNGNDELPEIEQLQQLKIKRSFQEDVFNQLKIKLEKTRDLAKTLFK